MKNNSDLERYQRFLESCKDSSAMKDDPVAIAVRKRVQKVATAWGWSGWIDDLIQETFLELCKGEYRGDGPLDGYVAHILGNKIRRLFRKEGSGRRAEMPTDMQDRRDIAAEIEARPSDRTKRLIARSPKHLWWFLEAIFETDGYLSERDAARIGKTSRYRIVELKKELREIWESMEAEQEPAETKRAKVTSAR